MVSCTVPISGRANLLTCAAVKSTSRIFRPFQRRRYRRPTLVPLGSPRHHLRPTSMSSNARDRYLVKSVVHSSKVLAAFRTSGEALPLREVAPRSGLPKSMVFRLLYTLERCGMVDKAGENLYRSHLRPFRQ